MKTSFKVKFVFENDKIKHLTYFVSASDMIQAEKIAIKKLGQKGKDSITSTEITPIVLNDTIGKPGKEYKNFQDQIDDDPRITELAFMWMRGDKKTRKEIEEKIKILFDPLDPVYTRQAMNSMKLKASLVATLDLIKYGKKSDLEGLTK